MVNRLLKLQSSERFADSSELFKALREKDALREEIRVLTKTFLKRDVAGCTNCYADAFFELLTIKKEKAMGQLNVKFELRAGALLQDVANNDIAKNMSNANITDELSIYHLRTNPDCRRFFTRLPENIEQLLIGTKAKKEVATEKEVEQLPEIKPEKKEVEVVKVSTIINTGNQTPKKKKKK